VVLIVEKELATFLDATVIMVVLGEILLKKGLLVSEPIIAGDFAYP